MVNRLVVLIEQGRVNLTSTVFREASAEKVYSMNVTRKRAFS